MLADDGEVQAFCSGLDDVEWNGGARPHRTRVAAELVATATALFNGRPITWHASPTAARN